MRPGNESTLCRTVQSFAGKDARTGRGTWRHVLRTNSMAKVEVAYGHSGVFDLRVVRQCGDLDGGSRRRIAKFKSASVVFVHNSRGYFFGQIGIHENHIVELQTSGFDYGLESVERKISLRRWIIGDGIGHRVAPLHRGNKQTIVSEYARRKRFRRFVVGRSYSRAVLEVTDSNSVHHKRRL